MNEQEQSLDQQLMADAHLAAEYRAFEREVRHQERLEHRREQHQEGISFVRFLLYGISDYIAGRGPEVHESRSTHFDHAEKRNDLNPQFSLPSNDKN